MATRDLKAVERSQRERAEIRRVWLELVQRQPFARHTIDSIGAKLPFRLARSTIHWHMNAIRHEEHTERTNGADRLENIQCLD
jgi:hypothetical protein